MGRKPQGLNSLSHLNRKLYRGWVTFLNKDEELLIATSSTPNPQEHFHFSLDPWKALKNEAIAIWITKIGVVERKLRRNEENDFKSRLLGVTDA